MAPAKTEAVRAAQRAFFQAALNEASAPVARPAPTAAPALKASAPEPETGRYLRPGSRIDIKV